MADRHTGSTGWGDHRDDSGRKSDRDSVVYHRAKHPAADKLLHCLSGRQRLAHRRRLHAVLHGIGYPLPVYTDKAPEWIMVRS